MEKVAIWISNKSLSEHQNDMNWFATNYEYLSSVPSIRPIGIHSDFVDELKMQFMFHFLHCLSPLNVSDNMVWDSYPFKHIWLYTHHTDVPYIMSQLKQNIKRLFFYEFIKSRFIIDYRRILYAGTFERNFTLLEDESERNIIVKTMKCWFIGNEMNSAMNTLKRYTKFRSKMRELIGYLKSIFLEYHYYPNAWIGHLIREYKLLNLLRGRDSVFVTVLLFEPPKVYHTNTVSEKRIQIIDRLFVDCVILLDNITVGIHKL